LNYQSFTAPDPDIWAAANQYPLSVGATRLIVIRNADTITRWEALTQWMDRTRQLPGVYLLFVADDLPARDLIKAPRGSLVKCTMPGEADALAWVRRRAELDETTARYLLERVGGDLDAAAGVCAKLALFDGRAGTATVNALAAEQPGADFADTLLQQNRRQALLSASRLGEPEYGKVIALLDSRLDLLAGLHRAQIAGRTWREITGVNPYLVRRYLPLARHYDPTRCAYRRRVLAVVDDAVRSGARIGVWEALVALW
jgi:DNA polymerase III delta subunit